MSLFDYFARDPWFEFQKMPSIFDQDYGRAMRLSDLVKPMFDRLRTMYFRPWRQLLSSEDDGSDFQVDEEGFKVVLDVVQFSPSEITVKVVGNMVVVEGKHEERRDEQGYVSRHFIRRYTVPSGIHLDTVTSALSSDGILTVSAPKVQAVKDGKARVIPIIMTATPAARTAEKVHEIKSESRAIKNTQKVHETSFAKTGSSSVRNTEKVFEIPINRKESTCVKNTEAVHETPMVRKEYTLLKNEERVNESPVWRKESTVVRNTEKVHEAPIFRKESTEVRNTERVHEVRNTEKVREVPIFRKESTEVRNSEKVHEVRNTEKVHEIPVTRKESSFMRNTEKVHEIPISRKESTVVKNTEKVHEIPIDRKETTVAKNTEIFRSPMVRRESTVVKNTQKFHEIQVISGNSSGFNNVENIHDIQMLRGESTDAKSKQEGRVREIPITRSESGESVCTVKTMSEADEKSRDIPISRSESVCTMKSTNDAYERVHDIPIAMIESPAVSIFDGEKNLDYISRTQSTDFNITEVTSEKGDDD